MENKLKDNHRKRKMANWLFRLLFVLTAACGCLVGFDVVRAVREKQFWADIRALRDAAQGSGDSDEEETPGYILPEYRELYVRNSDMIGWLKIEGARIDCPVMQSKADPEYYLQRDFDGKKNTEGTPFVDARCSIFPRRSFNLILYGHYSNGDRLFRRLLDYGSEPWALEHKIFQFDTLGERGVYEVVAAFYYDGTDVLLNSPNFNAGENAYTFYNYIELDSKEGFEHFLDEIDERNLYQADTGITPQDELLSIVCCAPKAFSGIEKEGRFVVVAKRVQEEEGE